MENNEQNLDVGQEIKNNEAHSDSYEDSTDVETSTESIEDVKARLEEAQAEASKYKRMLERKAKKADKTSTTDKKESDGFDYGQLAYLQQNGIESDHQDFVQEEMESSGLELKDLLKNGYFQSKLKARRDSLAVQEASPQGKTRSSTEAPSSKVDYWLQKGGLPENTPDNFQLRADIVNARIAREKSSKSNFSTQSIVEGV